MTHHQRHHHSCFSINHIILPSLQTCEECVCLSVEVMMFTSRKSGSIKVIRKHYFGVSGGKQVKLMSRKMFCCGLWAVICNNVAVTVWTRGRIGILSLAVNLGVCRKTAQKASVHSNLIHFIFLNMLCLIQTVVHLEELSYLCFACHDLHTLCTL